MFLSDFLTVQPGKLPLLLPTEVHIWRLRLSLIAPHTLLTLQAFLSHDECKRLSSLQGEKHKQSFISSRGALRFLIGHYLHCSPSQISFSYGAHGKPFVEKSSLSFNVSHSGDVLLYAVTQDCCVGIDIEQLRPLPSFLSIMNTRFSQTECLTVLSLPADQQQYAFFQIWTKKEAYLKALGRGFTFPFPSTHFTSSIEETASFRAETGKLWHLSSLPLDGYAATVVLEELRTPIYYDLQFPF